MILFDDHIELFEDDMDTAKLPTCTAVPLKVHFSLKDLWVPAELLINRKKAIDSTRNRPNIFHTLNRLDVKSFSVYFEDSKHNAENGTAVSPTDGTDSPEMYFSGEDDPSGTTVENSEDELKHFLVFLNKESDTSHDQKYQNATINTKKQDKVDNPKQPEPILDTLKSESPITIEDNKEFLDKKNSENLLDSVNTEKQNEVENSLFKELPIAYKKDFLQDPPTKQKNQKEKKKKNASKNIQLGDFLQTANLDGYEIPEKDEFYENLVRQGKCAPIDVPNFTHSPGREIYFSPKWDSFPTDLPKESSSPLSSNACARPLIELNENVQSGGVEELGNEILTTTLVLENISCNISKENVESLMSGYGELRNVSLENNGKSLKAYVNIILDDVEWIMDCLNGTEPFGASGETLKCYQLQE